MSSHAQRTATAKQSSSSRASKDLPEAKTSQIAYTQREKAALGLLRSKKMVTPKEVEGAIWRENDKPFNARIIAAGVLRSLKAKAERNREGFRIDVVNHGRLGSHWRIKR